MVGKSFSFSLFGDYDVYVVKVNSQGVVQWSKTYGGSGTNHNEIGYSIDQTNDGGYIISGESMFGFGVGLKNSYLIKTDSLGNSGCNEGTAATITSNFLPQVNAPPTLTSSGGVVSYPATIVNSGTTLTNLCFSTKVDKNYSSHYMKMYPNPFQSSITLEFNLSETKNISMTIVDVVGRAIKNIPTTNLQQGKNKITIDLAELKSGIYFCKIKSSENLQTIKLIRN